MTVETCKRLLAHFSKVSSDESLSGNVRMQAAKNYSELVAKLAVSKDPARAALAVDAVKKKK